MYQIRNNVYSDAGYILVGENKKGYQFEGLPSDFTEVEMTLDDMRIVGNVVLYGGVAQLYSPDDDYGKLKADMVKRRYSYDDQIAIMLNKDNGGDDMLNYQRMQAWREWSSRVAAKILEVAGKQ